MFSGSWIKPPLMAKLPDPEYRCIEENSGSIQAFYNMAKAIDPMAIFCGLDVQHMPLHPCSAAAAFVSGLANFCPDLVLFTV